MRMMRVRMRVRMERVRMRVRRERHAKERKKTRGGREIVWTNGKGGKKFLGKASESSKMIGLGGIQRVG